MHHIPLTQKALAGLAGKISVPAYPRDEIQTGIVHIGVGGFHRAHQAYCIHQLLTTGGSREWGICGVGLREADRNMYEVLQKQDGLYTLMVQHPEGGRSCEVIGSITENLLAVDSPDKVLEKMAHPHTRIVSLTITEGGYNFHPHTGEFNADHPDIQHELAHPDQPRTVFGYLAAALQKRQAAGLRPFTVLSCDNIQHNGEMARAMLLSFARLQNTALASWIEQEVVFPNTMVDRITPVSSKVDIAYLQETYGLSDEWPVVCEPFFQWVVEDRFSNGRPALEEMGVQFVPDVAPYEKMKLRLLNAGHSVLGIPGALYGHPTIDACMRDEVWATFLRQFLDQEATPVLDATAGVDLDLYKDSLEARFANPHLKDQVSRICSESAAKLPKFLIPTLQENLDRGGKIACATLILAAWCYYSDRGINEQGASLDILDEKRDELHQAAREDPLRFLGLSEIFGELGKQERFVKQYQAMTASLYRGTSIRELIREIS